MAPPRKHTQKDDGQEKGSSGAPSPPTPKHAENTQRPISVITGTLCSLFPNIPRGSVALPCPRFTPSLNSTI